MVFREWLELVKKSGPVNWKESNKQTMVVRTLKEVLAQICPKWLKEKEIWGLMSLRRLGRYALDSVLALKSFC